MRKSRVPRSGSRIPHPGSAFRSLHAFAIPNFLSASSGHPSHRPTNVLPMYCRSWMPILVVQKPVAVRSRKLLKNATPCASSGLARLRPRDVVEDRRALCRRRSRRTACRSAR